MQNSKYYKVLPVQLTPEEFETKSRDLADLCKTINLQKDKQKYEAKLAKDAIDELESIRFNIATVIQDKAEERQVECEDRYNFHERMVESVRLDTGEVTATRAMALTEYQQEMDLHAVVTPVDNSVPFNSDEATPSRRRAKG